MSGDFEELLRQAVVDKFFEPSMVMMTTMAPGPNGIMQPQVYPSQTEAPSMRIARAVWDANQQAITDAVMARLDVDELVELVSAKTTKAVLDRLLAEPDRRWNAPPSQSERERMLAKVYEDVAAEFGRQAVEHLRRTGGLMAVLDAGTEPTP